MSDSNDQTLIVELKGQEENIQKLLEKLESQSEEYKVEIKAVTIRND